jgi:hypothetical protein
MEIIEQIISTLDLTETKNYKNISLTFLKQHEQKDINILNWDEALSMKFLEVSEVDGGNVEELFVHNTGVLPIPIFSPEGCVYSGLKQSRATRVSFLVGPRQSLLIPVHCVEASRWQSQSVFAKGSPYHLYSKLRAINLRHTSKSMKNRKRYQSDGSQSASWDSIRSTKAQRERQSGRNIQSPGEYVGDIYMDAATTIEDFVSNLLCPADAVGYVAMLDNHVVAAEIFGSPKLFSKNYDSLLSGLALEATDNEFIQELRNREPLTVEEFLRSIGVAPKERYIAIGNGVDVRFETSNMVGAALVDDNDSALYHLEAFAV